MSKGGSENAVIVGGDADLILQGLALTEVSAKQYFMRVLLLLSKGGCTTPFLCCFFGPPFYCTLPPSLPPSPWASLMMHLLFQVKNAFICSHTGAGSFRLSSMWEVVRSLEEMFPGQSEFVRNDLAVLIMLNGNDYLPKVRGVSFGLCFRSYTSLKNGKHR